MLEVQNLVKAFDGRRIFDRVQVGFEPGKSYALVGASGSGKTTLLNILAYLEPFESGQVLYDGKSLTEVKSQHYFRDHMGYVLQNFGLIESQSVKDNLDLGFVGKKLSKSEKISRQKRALEQVNLGYLDLKQKVFTLSGGEAQRVAIAKLILKNPPLILADEPTAALDETNGKEVIQMILSLLSEERTIIIATHDPLVWEQVDEVIDVTGL
ncbi:ABC transporter ATP-binding protein [Dolosigranulum pigrum]|nr:ABC transporter ATP-binding protein [Dolosigranulum pigrum]